MKISAKRNLLAILIILPLILSLFGCNTETEVKPDIEEEQAEKILQEIIANNEKIGSFFCTFGLFTWLGREKLQADGIAFIDKENKRIRVDIIDPLLERRIVSFAIVGKSVVAYFYNQGDSFYIEGEADKIDLNVYFTQDILPVDVMMQVLNAEIPIDTAYTSIKSKPADDGYLIQMNYENRNKVLLVDAETNRPKRIGFAKGGKLLYRFDYLDYKEFEEFYIPRKTEITTIETGRKTRIAIQKELVFGYDFKDSDFVVDIPQEAEKR